jgi:hypothetical protein
VTAGEGHDPVAADEKRALDALRLAYHIGRDHGTWTATSKDGGHRTFTGDTPGHPERPPPRPPPQRM